MLMKRFHDMPVVQFLPFTLCLSPRIFLPFIFLLSLITACDVLPQVPTITPTRRFSAATLAPSPEVLIQNSDELYGDTIRDGQSNPTAAALPVDAPLPPIQSGGVSETGAQAIQVFMEDASIVTGNLYERGSTDNRSPGILILAQSLEAWGSLPADLFNAGHTVLIVNLPDILYAEDMDVLLTSLAENGSVDPARIAVIGAENTADMAILGCAIYEICDAVIMLSPQSRSAILNVLPNYNPRPMFIAVALNDADSYVTASSIVTSFAEGSRFVEQSTGTGTGLLTLNSELSIMIIDWLSTVWT